MLCLCLLGYRRQSRFSTHPTVTGPSHPALSHVQRAEREWKQWWDGLTPEQQLRHNEVQAAQWHRHWASLTPAQQEEQRRRWKEDWDRHWNGLTAAQQQEQRRKWKEERDVKDVSKRRRSKPAA